ncbi:MAG: aminoacetone oxidase family FAD-binding enzyme, partial [Oscillospiraceae bacterium]|nr:aminoacetone oxidase family FAD-binding enzyme [Oscillospiraceae bacterium]
LVKYAKQNGVRIFRKTAQSLWIENGKLLGVITGGGERIAGERVVLATGGLSYPATGSTGDGYSLAAQAGHTVIPPRPSLIPIETRESWCTQVQGLSLRNVTLTLVKTGMKKPVYFEMGELLCTHFGVSGPLVLSASAHMRADIADYSLFIDLKPALDEKTLDARILRDFAARANKDIQNALGDLLPASLIPVILRLADIPAQTKAREITRAQRHALLENMKRLALTPERLRPIEEAVVTAGGVDVSQVNPKTMESKLLPGLFFAGEVLDVDAYTGGFNLQIAFSTGRAAGAGIS